MEKKERESDNDLREKERLAALETQKRKLDLEKRRMKMEEERLAFQKLEAERALEREQMIWRVFVTNE